MPNVAECGHWRRAICSPPSFDAACPAKEIVTLAERGKVCAIALGSDERSGSRRFLIGNAEFVIAMLRALTVMVQGHRVLRLSAPSTDSALHAQKQSAQTVLRHNFIPRRILRQTMIDRLSSARSLHPLLFIKRNDVCCSGARRHASAARQAFDLRELQRSTVMHIELVRMNAGAGQVNLSVDSFPATIGRASDADVRLQDPYVSRWHCQIMDADGAAVVRDLGSKNGTFVNGNRITEAPLLPGQILRLGASHFLACYKLAKDESQAGSENELGCEPKEGQGRWPLHLVGAVNCRRDL